MYFFILGRTKGVDMSTATELLNRADEICSRVWDPKAEELSEEIRAFLAAEEQYDALSEHYVEGLGNSMKACKESFEREAERVKELLTAEPEAEPYTQSLYPELTPRAEQKFGYAIQLNDGSWVVEFSNDEANGAQEVGRTVIPLYTRPESARKPMTDREIMDLAKSLGFDDITTMDFAIGFRYAEKHHGIGGDDD